MIYKVYIFIHVTSHSYLNYEHAPSHPYTPNVRFVNVFDEDDEEFVRYLQQNYGDRWEFVDSYEELMHERTPLREVGECGAIHTGDVRENILPRSGSPHFGRHNQDTRINLIDS